MLERNVGAVKLTVNQMVKQLSNAYVPLIKSEVSLKSFPSVMGASRSGKITRCQADRF